MTQTSHIGSAERLVKLELRPFPPVRCETRWDPAQTMYLSPSRPALTSRLPSIGFVLVTYNLPEQTISLCRKLTEQFGAPPIAVHHDFGQSPLDRRKLPSNVRVVDRWRSTGWGVFAVVEANLDALRLLYDFADPDWCVSLSGADYPIKSAEHILTDLHQSDVDAFLDYREIQLPEGPNPRVRDESRSFADPAWLQIAYDRYVATNLNPDRLTWRFGPLHRQRLLRGRLARRLFTPFHSGFRPFGGDTWYTVNRKAAAVLLDDSQQVRIVRRHFSRRRIPEESAYHTILCNTPDLRLCRDNLRYTDWARGGPSPRYLIQDDIPALLSTGAHFARKFPFNPALFRAIDQAVGKFALQPA